MTLRLGVLFADAAALLRSERELVLALVGVFFVAPVFGALLLFVTGVPAELKPEQVQAVLAEFQRSNLLWLLLAEVVIDFGTFAIFNLYLQGSGRTLGEILLVTVRRFPLFLAIDLVAGMGASIGFWLFILPGLFVMTRTWLATPAFAADPVAGPLEAFVAGWRRSAGWNWLMMLAAMAIAALVAMFVIVIASGVLGTIGERIGDAKILPVVTIAIVSLVCGAFLAMLSALRVAAYRLTGARQGI